MDDAQTNKTLKKRGDTMAIRTKEELLNALNVKLGEATDDETLSLIEDLTDTISDYESRTADDTNWKQKYEENDETWRNKYKERFFSSPQEQEEKEEEKEEHKKPMTFEDLFK